jgi:hypothetical protein
MPGPNWTDENSDGPTDSSFTFKTRTLRLIGTGVDPKMGKQNQMPVSDQVWSFVGKLAPKVFGGLIC